MKIILYIYIYTLSVLNLYAQNKQEYQLHMKKIDSLIQIDYISYNYQYLDENFNICISKKKFKATISKYKYYKDRIQSYTDSLNIALMAEFGDFDQARMAKVDITFNWQDLEYYLWLPTSTLKSISTVLGFYHPMQLYNYFYNGIKTEAFRDNTMDALRQRLYDATEDEEVLGLDNKKLMKYAFHHHPKIVTLKRAHHKAHGH